MKAEILLAEDDPNLGTILKDYLEIKGYKIDLVPNGIEAVEKFNERNYDLAILDVMMPKMDGFTLAKEIRKINKELPVIFLTAKSLQEDKIEGLRIGADDYITKPFNTEELLLRIEAVLRRTKKKNTSEKLKLGKYIFDYNNRELRLGKNVKRLTSKECELLWLLSSNLNSLVDRSEALIKIWKEDNYFTGRSMDVYVTKLRSYLKDDENIEIVNVHGTGFKLILRN